jgi:hypothetical protein
MNIATQVLMLDGREGFSAELLDALGDVAHDVGLEVGIAEGTHVAGELDGSRIGRGGFGAHGEDAKAARDMLELVAALEPVGGDVGGADGALGAGRADFDAGVEGVPIGEEVGGGGGGRGGVSARALGIRTSSYHW